jgi:hypothetical protein
MGPMVRSATSDLRRLELRLFVHYAARLGVVAGAAALFSLTAGPANALPIFARQTGQPCAKCHTAFPELTPFGRRFKIGGYTLQGGKWQGPPIAAMYMGGFTHTNSGFDYPSVAAQASDPNANPQSNAPPPGLHANDNLASQQASIFVAGRLVGNLGSFIQVTGDPIAGTAALDSSDVRYADSLKLFGQDTILGIDVNNSPTVEDPWNTTPSWGWPQISSTIAPAFGPPLTHIEGSYTATVGGAGLYSFWNDMLYASVIAYKGLPVPVLQALNVGNSATDAVTNVAPYWRLALEPHWGEHYLMVGTFGIYGQVAPGRQYGIGTDNYLDVGFDSQYQYDGDQYSVTVKLTDIMEWQRLNASYYLQSASNLGNTLNSFKANASFVWDHTYSLGLGYFNITGSSDCNMYGSIVAPCTPSGGGAFPNSYLASPNGNGIIVDLAYIPFAHGAPGPYDYKTWNARIGLQFTSYLHLYGGTTNFDGSSLGGTHNASGNNSVFAYAWVAF